MDEELSGFLDGLAPVLDPLLLPGPNEPLPVPAAVAEPAPAPEDEPLRKTRRRTRTPRAAQVDEEEDKEERKRRRLALNRESARECRRRKRELTLGLEKRLSALQAENDRLRGCLLLKETDQRQLQEQKSDHENLLQRLISEGASDEAIGQAMHEFKATYADYGEQRSAAVEFHVAQLERLLLPTQVTKMIMWSLQQDSDFWKEGPDSLSSILSAAVDLQPEQRQQMITWRGPIRETSRALKQSLDLLESLKAKVATKTENFNERMDAVQSILTPTQAAKFVLWVSRNPSCKTLLSVANNPVPPSPSVPVVQRPRGVSGSGSGSDTGSESEGESS